jgi:DNA-binding NarL/FixJ family response regulator
MKHQAPPAPSKDGGAADSHIQVLVADDHPVVRFGLVSLINAQPGMTVVGEAPNCNECEAQAVALAPDIVILDLAMGDCSGTQAVERLVQTSSARILVFTSHREEWLVAAAMRAGVRGYVNKGTSPKTLIHAINAVSMGQKFLDPTVTSIIINQLTTTHSDRDRAPSPTPREMEVLRNVAMGRKNKEISKALSVSERTVKFHISALLRKLDAANRTDAVRVGIQLGLLSYSSTTMRAPPQGYAC